MRWLMSKFFNLSTFTHTGCVCRHLLVTVTIHQTAGVNINILYVYKSPQLTNVLCNALSNLMFFLLYKLRTQTNVITNRLFVVVSIELVPFPYLNDIYWNTIIYYHMNLP